MGDDESRAAFLRQVKAQAREEIKDEQLRAAVDRQKEKIRWHSKLRNKLFGWRIRVERKKTW